MPTLTVNASRNYKVMIESGLIDDMGELIMEAENPQKVCIISDTTVFDLLEEGLSIHSRKKAWM